MNIAKGIRNVINPAIKNWFGDMSVQLKISRLMTAIVKTKYFKLKVILPAKLRTY
jgi:hypothetical protein